MSGLVWPVREQLLKLRDGNSLLKERAANVLLQWSNPPEDPAEWLDLALQSERLAKIAAAGQQNNAELIQTLLEETEPKHWQDVPVEDIPLELQQRAAESMFKQISLFPTNTQPKESYSNVQVSFPYRTTIEHGVRLFKDTPADVDINFNDYAFDNQLVNTLNDEQVKNFAAFVEHRLKNINFSLNFRVGADSEVVGTMDEPKAAVTEEALEDFKMRARGGKVRWCRTDLPGEIDAKIDGIPLKEYRELYYKALGEPYEAVFDAQAEVINALNKGTMLHFSNNDGTNIFACISNHTFANSTNKRNQPGSEMFSGPNTASVTGTLVAKGTFAYELNGQNYVMKDITLHIHKGEVVEGHAAEGDEGLQRILSHDDDKSPDHPQYHGSRRVGEVGIGTNSVLTRQLTNILMVEKTSGSFHLALGNAYPNLYLGEQVLMDNGNKSRVHWDITTMLRGKEGKIRLDGHLLQDNGRWLACPELGISQHSADVLNDGWAALGGNPDLAVMAEGSKVVPLTGKQVEAEQDQTVTR